MIKPPFSMSKFMSEEAMHKIAHQYYKEACEDLVYKIANLRQDDSAYNTESVLRHLIKATNHLLLDHDCDIDGHEHWHTACVEGQRILKIWEIDNG